MASAFRVLAILWVILGYVATSPAQAQCGGELGSDKTGDATYEGTGPYTVSMLVANGAYRQALVWGNYHGTESDFNFDRLLNSCTVSSADCMSRRIVNSAILARSVYRNGGGTLWHTYIGDHLNGIDFTTSCTSNATTTLPFGTTDVKRPSLRLTIFRRTAMLGHEARHVDANRGHCGDTILDGECTCPLGGCDRSYSDNLANRATVDFIEQTLATQTLDIPAIVRSEALEEANVMLNEGFSIHPGFVLEAAEFEPVGTQRRTWDWSQGTIDLALFMGSNSDGPGSSFANGATGAALGEQNNFPLVTGTSSVNHLRSRFVTGFFSATVSLGVDTVDDNNLVVANLQGCRTLLGFIENRNLVWANDTTGCPNAATRGVPATPDFSQADSTSQGFVPRVMSGLKVRGSSSLNKVTAGVAAFRGLVNGVAMAPALELPAPDPSAFDVAILSPSGMFMTGFGFGAVDTTPTVQSGAASHSLGPEFEEYGGGFGGTSFMLACPTNKIPVGISSKAVLNPLGAALLERRSFDQPQARLRAA